MATAKKTTATRRRREKKNIENRSTTSISEDLVRTEPDEQASSSRRAVSSEKRTFATPSTYMASDTDSERSWTSSEIVNDSDTHPCMNKDNPTDMSNLTDLMTHDFKLRRWSSKIHRLRYEVNVRYNLTEVYRIVSRDGPPGRLRRHGA